ncbi:uncharacterized protein LOC131882422 isoform X1 [Tigriopus californicus]|uniref:uncharacterized protein LOC131882422 isoform X1 n=1 Tax=Tigriopus californicus TaxID=6832 RepID=UPI0027DA512C|nr:uncharacterized protein LOC131882422 isoform X1 [Tigriopus californicus]
MTLVPMSVVLLITIVGLIPQARASPPLTRGKAQMWDEEDLVIPDGQLLTDLEDPALFQLVPDQDPNNLEPGDLIAFDPDFPRLPMILKKTSPSNDEDEDVDLKMENRMHSLPKRDRIMGAHRFVRLYHHQPRPQRRYVF